MSARPVLILGAGSDIALALAHGFAAQGRPVMLAARQPDTLEQNRADLALRHDVAVSLHAYDALALEQAAAFLDGLPQTPGVVVCVVGLLGVQAETEGDVAKIRAVVDSNLTGPAVALEAAALRLAKLDPPGAVIGFSSVAGDRGRATNYWYGAAKAGLTAMLSGLRQKYARSGLLVITVKPGFVATRMTEGMDLPKRLTAQPEQVASRVIRALEKRREVVYVLPIWRLVMTIIRLIPERLFRKMKF